MNTPKNFIRELLAGPAAIIVLLAFFMPWITISCEGGTAEVTYSGHDMTQDQSEEDVEEDGDEALWIIPAVALLALGAVGMRLWNNWRIDQATRVYVIAGVIGLFVQLLKYLAIRSDMDDVAEQIGEGLINVTYEVGWWLTALGLIALVGSAFIPARDEDAGDDLSGLP